MKISQTRGNSGSGYRLDASLNPFRALRQRSGLSQYEIAKRAGVSKHAVLRLEQGCYDQPLPSLIEYFTEHHDITNVQLRNSYRDFQYKRRLESLDCLGESIADSLELCPVGIHPLVFLRTLEHLNPTQLAKMLCISQSTVVHFEVRSVHQHIVPVQLIEALHEVGYTEEDTEALSESYNLYREWLNASKSLSLVPSTVLPSEGAA